MFLDKRYFIIKSIKKMKLVYVIFLLLALVLVNAEKKPANIMDVVEQILQDPEYLSQSDYEQLRILQIIYSILEHNLISRTRSKTRPE